MRRQTLAFTIAGTLFGLVVGYMAASWDVVPRPAATAVAAARAPADPAPGRLDPGEARALASLAARQPGDAAVRVELGNLYMDAERWEEAIRWYREALALDASRPDVLSDLGACLVSSGRPAEALAELEKVLDADPAHRNALYNKGIALLRTGRAADAAAVWEELLARHPDDPRLQGLRGRIGQIRASAAAAAGK
jgi:tetratricopeptide (TPR) repeat protein